jgi:hypothetical protein
LHGEFSLELTLDVRPPALISELYFRNSAMASSCSSVKLNWGMLRRPGMPSLGRLLMKAMMPSLPPSRV